MNPPPKDKAAPLSPFSKQKYETVKLNHCSSSFHSFLFVSPPKIRLEDDSATPEICSNDHPSAFRSLFNLVLCETDREPTPVRTPLQDLTNRSAQNVVAQPKKISYLPDAGWVCVVCKNYNFTGRKKCNRCRKRRSEEKRDENTVPKRGKKCIKERAGDWFCDSCRNLNFAFREKCNRCGIAKSNSEFEKIGFHEVPMSERQAMDFCYYPTECSMWGYAPMSMPMYSY